MLAAALAVTVVASLGIGLLLQHSTESVAPFVDGGLVAASLVAQGMATRKWIENWLVWIAVNVVSIGLYLSQGLLPTTGLYLRLPRDGVRRLPRRGAARCVRAAA